MVVGCVRTRDEEVTSRGPPLLLFKSLLLLLPKSPTIQKALTPCSLTIFAVGDLVLGNYIAASLQAYYGFIYRICAPCKQTAAFSKDLV